MSTMIRLFWSETLQVTLYLSLIQYTYLINFCRNYSQAPWTGTTSTSRLTAGAGRLTTGASSTRGIYSRWGGARRRGTRCSRRGIRVSVFRLLWGVYWRRDWVVAFSRGACFFVWKIRVLFSVAISEIFCAKVSGVLGNLEQFKKFGIIVGRVWKSPGRWVFLTWVEWNEWIVCLNGEGFGKFGNCFINNCFRTFSRTTVFWEYVGNWTCFRTTVFWNKYDHIIFPSVAVYQFSYNPGHFPQKSCWPRD